MKVLFVVPAGNRPSTRYRVKLLLPVLQRHGVECDLVEWPKGFFQRRSTLHRCEQYDVTFLQRKLLPPSCFRSLKEHSARVVYDFDDAVIYRAAALAPEGHDSRVRAERFRFTVRNADLVIAGNRYLSALAAQNGAEAQRIAVIPTTIDVERWEPRTWDEPRGRPVVLGWMGTSPNLQYLGRLANVLSKLVAGHPSVRLRVVCDRFIDLPGVEVEKKVWRESEESEDVRAFDVGLAPLPDDPWARGKCAFKVLTYYAAGVPAVCSPVGMNREVVVEGETGFLASTEEEWLEKLGRLAADRELRKAMGARAREYVSRNYSSERGGKALADALRLAAGTPSRELASGAEEAALVRGEAV